MLRWLRSAAARLGFAVLALLLGWLAPLHAGGHSPSIADDWPTIQLPAVAPPPVVQVFLVAYRGQGPPEASAPQSHIFAAMEGQSGSTLRFFVVEVRALTHSAGAGLDEFGVLIGRTGTTRCTHLYSGYAMSEALGSYYLRARYYAPETGRVWIDNPSAKILTHSPTES